ncbi:MAG: TetR/AcrR family transcriptional regulator [Parvibaculaceae bacterium]
MSRDEWLTQALDLLAREGQAKLRIDAICKAVGVTKGSFYWHFKDRDDFVHSVVQFWSDRFTDPVMARVAQTSGSALDRLRALMHTVSEGGFARYDVSIRAWAAQDPELVASMVKAVDKRRIAFVSSLFAEMGVEPQDAEMRARACIAYLSFEEAALAKSAKKDRLKLLEQFCDVIAPPEVTEGRERPTEPR